MPRLEAPRNEGRVRAGEGTAHIALGAPQQPGPGTGMDVRRRRGGAGGRRGRRGMDCTRRGLGRERERGRSGARQSGGWRRGRSEGRQRGRSGAGGKVGRLQSGGGARRGQSGGGKGKGRRGGKVRRRQSGLAARIGRSGIWRMSRVLLLGQGSAVGARKQRREAKRTRHRPSKMGWCGGGGGGGEPIEAGQGAAEAGSGGLGRAGGRQLAAGTNLRRRRLRTQASGRKVRMARRMDVH
jgi:hypothetical protein